MSRPLREGFTTGTAATGAALAALHWLRHHAGPDAVAVPLPPRLGPHGDFRPWLRLPVLVCAGGPASELAAAWEKRAQEGLADPPPDGPCMGMAHATIVKDGGDDPDATSGARVTATLIATRAALPQGGRPPRVAVLGGPGVGRVSLPGLPVPVGRAAINPVPQAQIAFALQDAWARGAALENGADGLAVYVSVADGAAMARRTLNGRLGIVGGISILGTQGTVRPYSHDAWKASVAQALSVARATGCRQVCLCTGRRSERLLMARYPDLPATAFIQAADFVGFSLGLAGKMGFEGLAWGCFLGKLLKLAKGLAFTHAKDAAPDLEALARRARRQGAACARSLSACVTAAHAQELLLRDPAGLDVLTGIAREASRVAARFAGRPVRLHLFHTDGGELVTL